jgi:zinc finger-like protein
MLSWVTKSMTEDESNAMMSSLKSATKSTAFENWLGAAQANGLDGNSQRNGPSAIESEKQNDFILPSQSPSIVYQQEQQAVLAEVAAYLAKHNITGSTAVLDPIKTTLAEPSSLAADATLFKPGWEDIFRMNQKQLEAAVRRVSTDDSLEPQRKAYLIQHLMASRYIVAQQKRNKVLEKNLVESFMHHTQSSSHLSNRDPMPVCQLESKSLEDSAVDSNAEKGGILDGDSKSFHNQAHQVLGCKHYARKAKLIAPCCNKEYVCRLCHDEENVDHSMNRYQVREMRCMVCGTRQEVKKSCSECGTLLANYYCNICHLFDDDPAKDIYHCPFCNFCRRGKGLGIDSFHCMACNACMSLELFNKHKCTEAALAGTCPVCSDPLFESNTPIKELPCGHFMHSLCFGAYVRYSYTCPVCSKSLGDMEVYWRMIDAMLASEKLPMEYAKRMQTIRCHDCGTVSEAPFHFVYHKCSGCSGYNTRVIGAKQS